MKNKAASAKWSLILKELIQDPEASLLCPDCRKGDLVVNVMRAGKTLLSQEVVCTACGQFASKDYGAKLNEAEIKAWSNLIDQFYRQRKTGQLKQAVKTGMKLMAMTRKQNDAPEFVYVVEVAAVAQKQQPALASRLRTKARQEADTWLLRLLATRNTDVVNLADTLRTVGKLYLSNPAWKEKNAEPLNRKAEAYFRKAAALSTGRRDRVQDAYRGVVVALQYRGKREQARAVEKLHLN